MLRSVVSVSCVQTVDTTKAAMVSTVPQYSRMVDDQGVEMQPEHASHVGDSELTPLNLNPLAQQLHQQPAADDADQGRICLAYF